jgi:hypothetical protein
MKEAYSLRSNTFAAGMLSYHGSTVQRIRGMIASREGVYSLDAASNERKLIKFVSFIQVGYI